MGRRTDLLLVGASKEKSRHLSQSSVILNSKIGEGLNEGAHMFLEGAPAEENLV